MKAIMNKGTVTETYTLPSKGRLYGSDFPEDVTIRSMTTFEEKKRLGNQGFWKTMINILNAVVTEPEDFDAENLTLFDFYFMMYKMRTVSYGNIYKVKVTCPSCGKAGVYDIDLDNLTVNYLPEDFTEPFEVGPLPRSGDTLLCKLPRIRDKIRNEKRSQETLKRFPEYVGSPLYIYDMASQIVGINGEAVQPKEAELYVEHMEGLDSAYFQQATEIKTLDIGLDSNCHAECECGYELNFPLPYDEQFFRPTFDF